MRLAADLRTYRHLRWGMTALLVTIAIIPAAVWVTSSARTTASAGLVQPVGSSRQWVVAPGRVQPKDGVVSLAAPASQSQLTAAIVTALHVRPGEWVERGRVLATLRGREELDAALVGTTRKVAVAEARLVALRSGAKADDLSALRTEIQSDEAALAQLATDTQRAKQLHEQRMLSAAAMEAQESRLTVAARALEAKRTRLKGLSAVRPADVAVAEAELRAAEADVDEARARLENSLVRAPDDGRVLAIHAYPGQAVGTAGVLAFGRTAEMYVDAEVLEEDLRRTRVGQQVQITGDVLESATSGTVEEIGYLVGSREVFRNDPTAFADSRVVHVKIRATDPASLERFIDARVTVQIRP